MWYIACVKSVLGIQYSILPVVYVSDGVAKQVWYDALSQSLGRCFLYISMFYAIEVWLRNRQHDIPKGQRSETGWLRVNSDPWLGNAHEPGRFEFNRLGLAEIDADTPDHQLMLNVPVVHYMQKWRIISNQWYTIGMWWYVCVHKNLVHHLCFSIPIENYNSVWFIILMKDNYMIYHHYFYVVIFFWLL